jgi:hypothetical protein
MDFSMQKFSFGNTAKQVINLINITILLRNHVYLSIVYKNKQLYSIEILYFLLYLVGPYEY